MSNSNPVDVNALFGTAQDDGLLSAQAASVLQGVVDIGALINAGLGTPADQVVSSQSILCGILIDDSGSIAMGGNTDAVIDGHNGVIDALQQSKQSGDVLFYTRYLSGVLINPFCSLASAQRLNRSNYNPNGMTPLYRESVVIAGTVIAKTQEFADQGIPVRSITLIVTDGMDNQSGRTTDRDVASIVRDMLKQENHIVAAMGIGQTQADKDEFRQVFQAMGIPDQWILTPSTDPHEIRKAFMVFSQSAVRASQNAAHFSQAVAGGFGSP